MGTKTNPGQFDCYAKAAPDEPMFVLLGRDPDAALAVAFWAVLRFLRTGQPLVGDEADKIAEALACANTMDQYVRQVRGKFEDANASGGRAAVAFEALTKGVPEHPEGFDYSCCCDECCSHQ